MPNPSSDNGSLPRFCPFNCTKLQIDPARNSQAREGRK